MATQNRPVVGTLTCPTCDSTASVHQAQRASRKGLLYVRCPECGCDQRTGAKIQRQWRQAMTPRDGWEHLSEPEPQPNREPGEPGQAGVSEKPAGPVPEPKTEPKTAPKGAKLGSPLGVGLLVASVALLITGSIK